MHHSLCIFFEQVGLERVVSQVMWGIQGQQVTQAFQGLGFLEIQAQKVKYTFWPLKSKTKQDLFFLAFGNFFVIYLLIVKSELK